MRLALGAALLAAAALRAEPGPGRPVIGILELPALFGAVDPEGPPGAVPPAGGTIDVYGSPSKLARRFKRASIEDVPADEHAYEALGALVVGRSPGWFEIRLGSGTGWVAQDEAGAFHPLEELLKGQAYLTQAWDGRLFRDYSSPRGRRAKAPAGSDVQVLDARSGRRGLWLKVRVLGPGRCEGEAAPKVVDAGWLPAHAPSGASAAWFYARGC